MEKCQSVSRHCPEQNENENPMAAIVKELTSDTECKIKNVEQKCVYISIECTSKDAVSRLYQKIICGQLQNLCPELIKSGLKLEFEVDEMEFHEMWMYLSLKSWVKLFFFL